MPTGLFTLTQVNQAIRQGAWTGYIAPTWVEYLVVAGGGGGFSGGGGGGGLLSGVVTVLANTSYTVTVGAGGTGGASQTNGANSVFGSIAATGGGKGAIVSAGTSASGGSGGGGVSGVNNGSTSGGIGGQGISSQGNRGGKGFTGSATAAGGGGGAGTVGLDAPASNVAGNGGAGIASDISGTRTTYAGGGGGGAGSTSTPGAGGVGGGGAGANTNATSGGANTGGGGGGIYDTSTGGNGGSGIVIVRYPGTVQFFTGGTLSYANGYVIHTFYTSGTLAPTTPTPYVAADYQISRSLRFNSADSAYLNRTPASAGNRRTFTWSGWIKLSATGIQRVLSASSGSADDFLAFASDTLRFQITDSGGTPVGNLITTQVFRDYSSWYHIVVAVDTTQATASNRLKMYVNGVQVTDFSTATYPAQNTDTLALNTAVTHYLSSVGGTNRYLNGYMTEVNFIDGQALTPSSFGYYDFNTGVWTPMKYVGTYGTNGFYLNFSDNSNTTATTLGKDYSGNGNNWTPNNFSVSAGTGNDSLVDVPTSWGVDTGVGGTVRGNYCTLNPLKIASTATLSNGNLDYLGGSGLTTSFGTIGVSSGKWYFEATPTGTDAVHAMIGVANDSASLTQYPGQNANSWGYYGADGNKYNSGSATAYGAAFGANDVIGVALDMDAGTLTYYKNGVSQGQAFSGLTGTLFPVVGEGGTQQTPAITANFGQRPFAFAAPSGFKALCTQNLPTPTVGATASTQANKYFDVVLRNGGGSSGGTYSTTINMANGALLWDKPRGAASDHFLVDSVRGVSKTLSSNTIGAEATYANWFTGFNNGSFTTGSADWGTGTTVVDWIWAANGAGVTNTAGSITSTVSANTTSGFSVVTYTGTGATPTVGHGLGAVPKMIIVKVRNDTNPWNVYHVSTGATNRLLLNDTSASATSGVWNNTTPTSSVFSLGAANQVNQAGLNFVAYCFAEVPGFSKFGSYTGNNSTDGPFVYCGFRPAYVMVKCSSEGSGDKPWVVKDKLRAAPYNPQDGNLYANLSNAEDTTSTVYIDFLSNGFKIRGNYAGINAVQTYIFAAFAEFPQKFSLAR